jgi:hypothetical protein
MIKGLMGTCGVTVSAGNTTVPYINQNHSNPMQGMIRIWGSDMQVFDGTAWMTLSTSYATVTLDQDILDIIQWARTQRQLELNRATLIKNNPALQKAQEAIERAEENFELLQRIVTGEAIE